MKNIKLIYVRKIRMRGTYKTTLWEPLVERLDALKIRDLLIGKRDFQCFDIGV